MKRPPIVPALMKAALLTALAFTLAWIRLPLSLNHLASLAWILAGYGIAILLLAGLVGLPLVLFIEKLRAGSWWVYTLVAAFVGTVLSLGLVPSPSSEGATNPFAFVFSPWTRPHPGFVDVPPVTLADYVGSAIFGTLIGALLGFSFWRIYTHGAPPNNKLQRTRGSSFGEQ